MSTGETVLLKRFTSDCDTEAFSQIVQQHAPLVYGVCLRILEDKDKAADAVQDTFFQLVRNAANIKGSLTSWLHRVATNRAIDLARQDSQRKQRELKYAADAQRVRTEQEKISWQEISEYVDQEIDKLDDQVREVLILHFLQGKTASEVAEKCGISHQTVSRRLDSGITTLRQQLRSRGVIASVAVLAALLGENIVHAAPEIVMTELGKMAIACGASAGVKVTAGAVAGAAVKAKIIAVAAAGLIVIGSAGMYYNYSRSAEPSDIPQPEQLGNTVMVTGNAMYAGPAMYGATNNPGYGATVISTQDVNTALYGGLGYGGYSGGPTMYGATGYVDGGIGYNQDINSPVDEAGQD
jgi:RNA polymerase sigma factor (sigma-70 family)